jgi:hypothetical protein
VRGGEKTAEELRMKVTNMVKADNWTESLATAVLARLDEIIKVNFLPKKLLILSWNKRGETAVTLTFAAERWCDERTT